MSNQCKNCEYIGACPHLDYGSCEGGPHNFIVEDGKVYMLTPRSELFESESNDYLSGN